MYSSWHVCSYNSMRLFTIHSWLQQLYNTTQHNNNYHYLPWSGVRGWTFKAGMLDSYPDMIAQLSTVAEADDPIILNAEVRDSSPRLDSRLTSPPNWRWNSGLYPNTVGEAPFTQACLVGWVWDVITGIMGDRTGMGMGDSIGMGYTALRCGEGWWRGLQWWDGVRVGVSVMGEGWCRWTELAVGVFEGDELSSVQVWRRKRMYVWYKVHMKSNPITHVHIHVHVHVYVYTVRTVHIISVQRLYTCMVRAFAFCLLYNSEKPRPNGM